MWTFEYPPKIGSREAYNFTADDKWFEESACRHLRFAVFSPRLCPNGLIADEPSLFPSMVGALQKEGKTSTERFSMPPLADERRAGLVCWTIGSKSKTHHDRMLKIMDKASDDVQRKQFQDSAMMMITKEYNGKIEWKRTSYSARHLLQRWKIQPVRIQKIQRHPAGIYSRDRTWFWRWRIILPIRDRWFRLPSGALMMTMVIHWIQLPII